jgi:flagellar biogenesis protein FliO
MEVFLFIGNFGAGEMIFIFLSIVLPALLYIAVTYGIMKFYHSRNPPKSTNSDQLIRFQAQLQIAQRLRPVGWMPLKFR